MTFNGTFQRVLSKTSAIIMNDFAGDTTKSVTIGNHEYTVKIARSPRPGRRAPLTRASISALASVTVKEVPSLPPSCCPACACRCSAPAGVEARPRP